MQCIDDEDESTVQTLVRTFIRPVYVPHSSNINAFNLHVNCSRVLPWMSDADLISMHQDISVIIQHQFKTLLYKFTYYFLIVN